MGRNCVRWGADGLRVRRQGPQGRVFLDVRSVRVNLEVPRAGWLLAARAVISGCCGAGIALRLLLGLVGHLPRGVAGQVRVWGAARWA